MLEEAILDAAWIELSTKGYSNFTYEAVAKRACTSRPVLYRRWETRVGLAAAALARYAELNPIATPDLGNLRDELCLVLRRFADRTPPHLMRLWFEMNEEMGSEQAEAERERLRKNPLEDIVERAIERGEINRECVTPRVLSAPLGLVLHEIVITARPISDKAITEIIDQIFLPLVTAGAAVPGSKK